MSGMRRDTERHVQTIIGVVVTITTALILAAVIYAGRTFVELKITNAQLIERIDTLNQRVAMNSTKLDAAISSRYTSIDAAKDAAFTAEKFRALDARVTALERKDAK